MMEKKYRLTDETIMYDGKTLHRIESLINFNDVEMIKNAGLGVAMNNGSPTAKEVARVVAPSNDEEGVAKIMERYILNDL